MPYTLEHRAQDGGLIFRQSFTKIVELSQAFNRRWAMLTPGQTLASFKGDEMLNQVKGWAARAN